MNKKWLYLILMLVLLPACGQKGPLYLPEEPVQDVQSGKASAAANDLISDQG